jgi:hypothetical protein
MGGNGGGSMWAAFTFGVAAVFGLHCRVDEQYFSCCAYEDESYYLLSVIAYDLDVLLAVTYIYQVLCFALWRDHLSLDKMTVLRGGNNDTKQRDGNISSLGIFQSSYPIQPW